jgi:hypothetical protein
MAIMMKLAPVIGAAAAAAVLTTQQAKPEFAPTLEKEAVVAAQRLNVRTGPGMGYPVISVQEKDTSLEVIGAMGSWYLVSLPDSSVGMVSGKYLKITKMDEPVAAQGDSEGEDGYEELSDGASILFSLVNEARVKEGLEPFVWDERLNSAAKLKANDMMENSYFNHNSPEYGTPFIMLNSWESYTKPRLKTSARILLLKALLKR